MNSLQALLAPHEEEHMVHGGHEEVEAERLRVAINEKLEGRGGYPHGGAGGYHQDGGGKENAHPQRGMLEHDAGGGGMQMKSGVRGLQQMRRHGDKARDYNDDQYNKSLTARLKSRPF